MFVQLLSRGLWVMLLVSLVVPQSVAAFLLASPVYNPLPSKEVNSDMTPEQQAVLLEVEQLRDSLKERATYLEYTKYQMLQNKYQIEGSGSDYYLRPRGMSPLSREYLGIPITTSGVLYDNEVSEGVELITGERAIDESLQLGSIGARPIDLMTWLERRNLQKIQQALQHYIDTHGVYPAELEELVPDFFVKNQDTSFIHDFAYRLTESSYELTLLGMVTEPMAISAVEGLTIEHHPWQQMIGQSTPVVPDIYKLVPDDYFFVHFNNLGRYRELAETIANLTGPLAQVYGLGGMLATEQRIFDRLGIVDDPAMDTLFSEAAFISYDFDGYPRTDYALILKTKSGLIDNFIGTYLKTDPALHGAVGEYYVIASSEELLKEVATLAKSQAGSMAAALDLQYSLVALEEERDGLAFISDAFVEKVTSPAYRINARRRNVTLTALESLQYATFAYRDITGAWPKNIAEMMTEGYLQPGSVYQLEDYSIDTAGVVSHVDWGSVYQVTPIQRVAIETVLPSEKALYDRFRDGYQQYWREFIDPVAVSITVGDQIRLHTIILPLIDESDYNWMKDVIGSANGQLDFVVDPDRIPAIQFSSHVDVDSILNAIYQSAPTSFDQVYQKCRLDWRQLPYEERRGISLSERCARSTETLSPPESTQAVSAWLADLIDWEGEAATILDFIGDEITVAASEQASFMVDDLSLFDVYFGVELTDPVQGQLFVEQLFDWVAEELFSGSSMNMGLFGVKAGKPIRNVYKEVEYYMVPTGWLNLFYIFMNDRMYITLSQTTINALIDGQAESWPEHMIRLQDYLDDTPDMSLLLDGQKLDSWLNSYVQNEVLSYGVMTNFETMRSYLKEVNVFNQALVGETVGQTSYYNFVPNQWFGLPIEIRHGSAYAVTADRAILLDEVAGTRRGYSYNQIETDGAMEFEEFMEYVDLEQMVASWEGIDTFGADLSFTEEGLDIRVVFDNHVRTEFDERVPGRDYQREISTEEYVMIATTLGIVVLLLTVAGVAWRRRLVDTPVPAEQDSESSLIPDNHK